jgi:hypothetical protein
VGLVALGLTQSSIFAQVAPSLGRAAEFAMLGNSAVTGSAGSGSTVNGSVGSFPTASVTNFPPSTVTAGFTLHTTANATVQGAQADARTAYNFLAAQGGTAINNNLSTNGVLSPGVYSVAAGDLPASATMTLNGSGIFIFNVTSTLTMNVGSAIIGTANPCNVYWRVGTSATLNGTSFMGTVLTDASITVGSGNVVGRLLSGLGATGASTLSVGGNTIGGCSDPLLAPVVTKAFNATSIVAGATSQLTISLNNPNLSSITLNAALTDSLPSGVLVAVIPGVSTTCGGVASATAGGSTVSLASGSILSPGVCTISVNVTAAVPGTYLNTIAIGALQTSGGNNAVPATASLLVTCPVITLAPLTLPNGTVGVAYAQTITGSGGTAPYTFTVSAGTLPAGLTLTSAGVLAGTPTTVGSSSVTIRGADVNNCAATIVATIVIAAAPVTPPGCPVLTLAPSPLPGGTVGVAYSQVITGNGGTAPYTFGVTAGALPAGLTLTAAGLLAGTPTTAGSVTFTIRGTDALGCFVEVISTVVIAAAPVTPPGCPVITIAPPTLPGGTVGVAYSQAITGSGGTAPYTFGVTVGTLPAGLTLTAAGLLAGTPTTPGTVTFTIRGTDALGCFADVVRTVVVVAAPVTPPVCPVVTLSPATIGNGLVGQAWSQTLTASGGTAPYTFGLVSGALPTGVTLTTVGGLGLLSGTSTTNGSYAFTIRATDSLGCLAERAYVVAITTAVPTMPEMFLALLAVLLATVGYVHLRRQ